MNHKHTLTFFISTLLLIVLSSVSVHAQNDSIPETPKDSVIIKEKYGLRAGVDIGKLARSFFDDEFSGLEINADYRITKRLYVAGEIGYAEKNTVTDYLDVLTKGSYIKGGVDYNLYQNWLDMDNMIYTGFRVGYSMFSHDLNSYTIYNTNQYWPSFTDSDLKTYDGLSAFWGEFILGLKAEVLNNLYVGLNVQLKYRLSQTEPDNFENIYIPGYNKTYDSGPIGVGYGYTLSYRIPLYKKNK